MARKPRTAAPAEGEQLYDVLSSLDHDGVLYGPGSPNPQISLDAEAAADLVKARVIKPAATETPAT